MEDGNNDHTRQGDSHNRAPTGGHSSAYLENMKSLVKTRMNNLY